MRNWNFASPNWPNNMNLNSVQLIVKIWKHLLIILTLQETFVRWFNYILALFWTRLVIPKNLWNGSVIKKISFGATNFVLAVQIKFYWNLSLYVIERRQSVESYVILQISTFSRVFPFDWPIFVPHLLKKGKFGRISMWLFGQFIMPNNNKRRRLFCYSSSWPTKI